MLPDVPELLPALVELYKDLHAHPELSFAEHRTAAVVAEWLDTLGCEVTTGVGRTGVVGVLRNGDGPTVMLRADFDALPVAEATGLPYRSVATAVDADGQTVPVMHACGHDMHVVWLLGATAVLAADPDAWSGTVLLVFQPAEEVGAGADAMVDDGLFERFGTPVVALGQHVIAGPAGTVLYRPGVAMAASDSLKVRLIGRGGHGSRPETTVDPVVMAASAVMRLQTVVSREVAPTDTAVVTVGSMRAGTKANIIPGEAELRLSIRTFEPSVRERVMAAVERVLEGEAVSAGAPERPEISTLYSFQRVENDVEATGRVAAALREAFGPERVVEVPAVTGSEDFGVFGRRGGFPSVFWWIGGSDPEAYALAEKAGRVAQDIPNNHSPYFAPVLDPTLAAGVEAMTAAALSWLAVRPA
ncbi:hippurate hydrolase [Sinosporangium album]|uniref:Hippurate hydrolase n=2 Tax=Sinosporangium album TaxID=504805 RepID=A0A1G8DIG2_9ACTN|nr:hippurate hydrolase [Sinosporangium album]